MCRKLMHFIMINGSNWFYLFFLYYTKKHLRVLRLCDILYLFCIILFVKYSILIYNIYADLRHINRFKTRWIPIWILRELNSALIASKQVNILRSIEVVIMGLTRKRVTFLEAHLWKTLILRGFSAIIEKWISLSLSISSLLFPRCFWGLMWR